MGSGFKRELPIITHPATKEYRDGWERTFGKKDARTADLLPAPADPQACRYWRPCCCSSHIEDTHCFVCAMPKTAHANGEGFTSTASTSEQTPK